MRIDLAMFKKNAINLFSLAAIQGGNALFPILMFPYLYSVLGSVEFSLLVVSEAVMFYVLAVCLYSFDVTGVKDLIIDNNNEAEIYWTILFARLGLLLLSALLVLLFSFFLFPKYFTPLLVWLLFPLGMVLQSNYYFQAKETNIAFSLWVVISRLLACSCIYFFVNNPSDQLMAIGLIAGSFILSGGISLIFINNSLVFKFSYIATKNIVHILRNGFEVFLGNFSVSLFRGSNIIILSLVSTPYAVSVYSLTEKIIKSIQALARPLNQLAYPRVIKNYEKSQNRMESFALIWKNTKPQIYLLAIFLPLLMAAFYFLITTNLWKGIDLEVLRLISFMLVVVFFGVSNYMFGTIGMNLIGEHSYYAKAIFIAGIITIVLSIILSSLFNEAGAAFSFVFGELILLSFFLIKYKRTFG